MLANEAARYFCPRVFEDRDEAELASHSFIEFCRGRAWVFTDTGTTPNGDRLYQFTHRTFLEYFTAGHLARTHRTPIDLLTVLVLKISRKEWDVVAQLALQQKNRDMEGAADEMLSFLVTSAGSARFLRNRLSLAARCLEFIVPSPDVRRLIGIRGCNSPLTEEPHNSGVAVREATRLGFLSRKT